MMLIMFKTRLDSSVGSTARLYWISTVLPDSQFPCGCPTGPSSVGTAVPIMCKRSPLTDVARLIHQNSKDNVVIPVFLQDT